MRKEIAQAVEDRILEALCGTAVEQRTKVFIPCLIF